jgi:hypothetical protein
MSTNFSIGETQTPEVLRRSPRGVSKQESVKKQRKGCGKR